MIKLTTKVKHLDFIYIADKSFTKNQCPVAIFERREWIKLTEEQSKDYYRRKKIIEDNGGVMIKCEFECAGKNLPFNEKDINDMKKATLKAFPKCKIIDTWNGLGCYSFSIEFKEK